MSNAEQIRQTFAANNGIFRLAPAWVPRSFCIPGRRIKLHPDDYYALGGERGGIDERWLSSTTPADNGPLTGKNEGISHIVADDGSLIPLTEAVETLGAELIGERLWEEYHAWPVYSKFFDNLGPLPHHIHHKEEQAQLVGQHGKPESYYFPPQLNNHGGHFPFTFFGLEPGTTKEQVHCAGCGPPLWQHCHRQKISRHGSRETRYVFPLPAGEMPPADSKRPPPYPPAEKPVSDVPEDI